MFGVQGQGIDLAPLLCQEAAEIGAKERGRERWREGREERGKDISRGG